LKGRDAVVAKVLLEAAKISGCAFHLGIVHIEESGWAEYTGYGGGRRRRRYSDDEWEVTDDDYEAGEVCDSDAFIDEWRDSANRPVEFGKIPLGQNEVLPPKALDGEEPDEIHFSEATGNAGADFERCYLRAAVVLWPESGYDEICLSAGQEAGIARLGVLVRGRAKDSVEHMTELLVDRWKDRPENLDRLLRVLNEHGDRELLERTVSELVPISYDGSQNEALLGSACILQPGTAHRLLATHFESTAPCLPGAAMDFWNCLAALDTKQLSDSLLGDLLGALENSKSSAHSNTPWSANADSNRINAPTFSRFLELLSGPHFAAHAARVGSLPEKNPLLLDVEKTLLPGLESAFAAATRPPAELVNPLWQQAAVFYLGRSENPPPAPVDWAQQVSVGSQRSPELCELELFARDPVRQVHRFRINQQERQTIHQTIERLGLDMTHVTERKGRPYTLVCTKTRATYERACKQHQSDLGDMRRLLALPAAETPEFSKLTNRLLAASLQSNHEFF
jgi:hypothetical protein